jgi:hypothetical protein
LLLKIEKDCILKIGDIEKRWLFPALIIFIIRQRNFEIKAIT